MSEAEDLVASANAAAVAMVTLMLNDDDDDRAARAVGEARRWISEGPNPATRMAVLVGALASMVASSIHMAAAVMDEVDDPADLWRHLALSIATMSSDPPPR